MRLGSKGAWGAAGLAAVCGLAIGACGTPPADNFVAQRTGSGPDVRLALRVIDDGTVSCNGGEPVTISSKQIIAARALVDDLEPYATEARSLPARPGSTMQYRIRDEHGTVHFADNSAGQPPVFYRAQQLIRQLAVGPCRLAR